MVIQQFRKNSITYNYISNFELSSVIVNISGSNIFLQIFFSVGSKDFKHSVVSHGQTTRLRKLKQVFKRQFSVCYVTQD